MCGSGHQCIMNGVKWKEVVIVDFDHRLDDVNDPAMRRPLMGIKRASSSDLSNLPSTGRQMNTVDARQPFSIWNGLDPYLR